jgi:ribosomal protein S18 acetylase RimI-like enzyme
VITLVPMRSQAYGAFTEACVAEYAHDNVQAGRWPEHGAAERARAAFMQMLPQGLGTPDHFVQEICDSGSPEPVGFVWFALLDAGAQRCAYVYSIRVEPAFRGRGHAKEALDRVAAFVEGEGAHAVALHVFSFNTSALALYRSLGYGITGMNLLKPLRREAP